MTHLDSPTTMPRTAAPLPAPDLDPEHDPGFADAGSGDDEVEIIVERFIHQPIKVRVIEY